MAPVRVLCIDHEGGRGGSSRSLMFALLHMQQEGLKLHVLQRLNNDLADRYGAVGIGRSVFPQMPIFRAQNSNVDTLKQFAVFLAGIVRARREVCRLLEFSRDFDIIHANQESAFGLALLVWAFRRKRIVFHFRSRMRPTIAARLQVAVMNRIGAAFIFITENERDHNAALGADLGRAQVIYNPAVIPDTPAVTDARLAGDRRFKLCLIGNYARVRGQDRVIPILLELRRLGVLDQYVAVVAGDMATPRSGLPDDDASRQLPDQTSFADYVDRLGLGSAFVFVGHTQRPEEILAGADLVLKLGRLDEPWGRDVIEAYAQGRPVLGVGTWSGFVDHRQTGLLYARLDPGQAALDLEDMRRNPDLGAAWGASGRERVRRLCDPAMAASRLRAVWLSVARGAAAAP